MGADGSTGGGRCAAGGHGPADATVQATASAAAGACDLGTPQQYVSESPNAAVGMVPSIGQVDMTMLFVDFPDAPAGSESAQALFDKTVPPAIPFFQAMSDGRFDLQVHPAAVWLRMPHPSTSYGFPDLSAEQHLAFFRDAISVADPFVNFAGQEVVDVIPTQSATAINTSVTIDAGPVSSYFVADGAKVRYGSTFDSALKDGDSAPYAYAPLVFEHETGHVLGLPDLYATDDLPDSYRYMGVWDPMSDTYRGTGFNAWHRGKLGWLDPSQVKCVSKPKKVTTSLTPLDLAGGRKLLAIKYSPTKVITVEVRRPVGTDAGLCGQGVLISRVDSTKESGNGPIVVARAAKSTSTDYDCGSTANAAYQTGGVFRSGPVTVKVLGAAGTGYRVQATLARPASSAGPKHHRKRPS